ncbi:UNVERIFIED_CONTAM: ribosomal protein L36 (apicoplast) [Hammondia hammondi]|eukprot:XP_008889605.1 ribosomal protein L36 (apicoplast) [Hammondia hammondi]
MKIRSSLKYFCLNCKKKSYKKKQIIKCNNLKHNQRQK